MNVPLSVHAVEHRGIEKLDIWVNGRNYLIDSPIEPYFYSDRKFPVPASVRLEKVMGIALSDFKQKTFFKYHFKTRKMLVQNRNDYTYEDNIPFVIRHRIDMPDIFKKYSHSNNLKFLFLDIEQDCPPDKPFPDYRDYLTAISWATNDRVINTVRLKKETMTDKKMLEVFIEKWVEINPDVIVVYNKGYDLPTIFNRCIRNKIDIRKLSKSGKKPYVGGKDEISIDGCVIYDIWVSAKADQSITGKVPDRKLKTVSNWYGFKEERAPLTPKEMTELKGDDRLVEYNRDDVRRLFILFDVYWTNIEFNANDLGIPLNEAIQMRTSDLGLITLGDEYKRLGIISDGTNSKRYPEIFQRDKKTGEKNYQGALVEIYQIGLFEPLYKADFSSMYPKILAEFNLSPDTTALLEYRGYTGKFSLQEKEDCYIYNVPDSTIGKDMVIRVSKEKGFLSSLVSRYLNERSEYKKKWKETGDVKYRAISDNRKLKANGGVYGNMGYSEHPYGYAPSAVATCGIGRECADLLVKLLNELYHNSSIEADTDGVYFSSKEQIDKAKIFDLFEKRLFERFSKKLDLSIDIDEYDRGYFYKSKNYVLQKKGKIIFHGVALTASSHTIMKKELIRELADARLSKKETAPIIEKYYKLDFPLQWFAMNIKLGMPVNEYASKSSIACKMAMMAQEKMKIKPQVGNQYFYIKSKGDYMLYELATKEDIDYDYYTQEINKVLDIFSVDNPASTLDSWI